VKLKKSKKAKILIVEDEPRMRRLLELVLQGSGYQVETAADGRAGAILWRTWQPDLVLSDLKMPKMDGLELLRFRNSHFPTIPFILLTAFGTVETAVAGMKEGAYDYLTKPVDNNRVLELVAGALSATKRHVGIDRQMIGSSEKMQKIRQAIMILAKTDSSVLLTGESGTGKDLAARAIHDAYARQDAPYVQVNCPAIPKDLLESELFGHRRGAFTGAVENRKGAFSLADGGTIFLDEIGNLPLGLQPKLLHVVEQKKVMPVGGSKPREIHIKILSATNCDMESMVAKGLFRQDLYYRLNVLQLHLPPLRERREDIEELAKHFLLLFSKNRKPGTLELDSAALARLEEYSWPGNIRELRNVIESGCLRSKGERFTVDLLPENQKKGRIIDNNSSHCDADFNLISREKKLIVRALEQCNWNQSHAADHLGITRNTLRYRMKKYAINRV